MRYVPKLCAFVQLQMCVCECAWTCAQLFQSNALVNWLNTDKKKKNQQHTTELHKHMLNKIQLFFSWDVCVCACLCGDE